jgi:hypothetical protein
LAWDPTVGAFFNWYKYIVDHHYIIALSKMLYFFPQGLAKDFISVVGTDPFNVEELVPFSGCVVQEGLSKIAVYKDGDGNLHKFSGE